MRYSVVIVMVAMARMSVAVVRVVVNWVIMMASAVVIVVQMVRIVWGLFVVAVIVWVVFSVFSWYSLMRCWRLYQWGPVLRVIGIGPSKGGMLDFSFRMMILVLGCSSPWLVRCQVFVASVVSLWRSL